MNVIFLDDDENRHRLMKSNMPFVKQVYTADEAIAALKGDGYIDFLFLDHDLGGEIYVDSKTHNTGATVAKWMAENKTPKDIGFIIVHSYNPAGAKTMMHILKETFRSIAYQPFASDMFKETVAAINDKDSE